MLPRRFKDFNNFVKPVEPIGFRYGDRDYEISGKIPFQPMLEAMAMEEKEGGSEMETVLRLLEEILGKQSYDQLMKDLDMRHAEVVLQGIIEMVMEDFSDQAEAGEVEGLPEGKAVVLREKLKSRRSTSSSTGTDSKPTSGGITLSNVTRSAS
jgi:hypothetical protein